jgi:hypothetical protein
MAWYILVENRKLLEFCSADDRKEVKKKEITKEMDEVKKKNKSYANSYDSKVEWNKEKDDWEEKKYAKEKPSEERPFVNGNFHHAKHRILDLRWGSVYVYKTKGKFYGHGDMAHCDDGDIKWNMVRLREIMIKCKITAIWKAYDSDMGDHTNEKHDLETILKEAEQYGEQVYEILEYSGSACDDQVRIIPENKIKEVKKYTDTYPTPASYDDGIIIS